MVHRHQAQTSRRLGAPQGVATRTTASAPPTCDKLAFPVPCPRPCSPDSTHYTCPTHHGARCPAGHAGRAHGCVLPWRHAPTQAGGGHLHARGPIPVADGAWGCRAPAARWVGQWVVLCAARDAAGSWGRRGARGRGLRATKRGRGARDVPLRGHWGNWLASAARKPGTRPGVRCRRTLYACGCTCACPGQARAPCALREALGTACGVVLCGTAQQEQ